MEYFAYPWFWIQTFGGLAWLDIDIDFTRKFLLDSKISHIWEEQESSINRIWWGLVNVRCYQKKALWLWISNT